MGLIAAGVIWEGIVYYLNYNNTIASAENNPAKDAFITLINPENDIPDNVKKATISSVPDVVPYIDDLYKAVNWKKLLNYNY